VGAMRGRGTTWAEEEGLEDTGGVAAAMAAAESASRPAGASGLGSSRIRVRVLASTRARSCQAIAAGEATYAHARVRQLEAAAVLQLEGLLDGSNAFGRMHAVVGLLYEPECVRDRQRGDILAVRVFPDTPELLIRYWPRRLCGAGQSRYASCESAGCTPAGTHAWMHGKSCTALPQCGHASEHSSSTHAAQDRL